LVGLNVLLLFCLMLAAKTMALTAIDLYTNPAVIVKVKEELKKSLADYKYVAQLGDRKLALNYWN